MLNWLFAKRRKQPEWTIHVHMEAQTSNETAAAWAVYSGTKALVRIGQYYDLHPERRGLDSPFDEEWFARDALAEHWATNTPDFQATDRYLSMLVGLRADGLMREYVWTYLRDDGWLMPNDLDLHRFQLWWAKNGEEPHRPRTLSSIEPA